jgi:hypothetical protein
MQKIIWTCWFQGRQAAPELVQKCMQSWEERNPGWGFRCLDAQTIPRYVDLSQHLDLSRQSITAASLSDILRVLLLHEYGGVWVDATTFCNVPLDDWLPAAAHTGFFAFSYPGLFHPFDSWFLAAEPGNTLLAKLATRVVRYWRGRERSDEYFWIYRQFGELCANDRQAFQAWQAVPRIAGLERPHAVQFSMYEDFDAVKSRIDWTAPVFKLTHRLDHSRLTQNCLIARVLNLSTNAAPPPERSTRESQSAAPVVGVLKVGTENLGDHIQIIAAENLLRRAGLTPSFSVDRDDGLAHPPPAQGGSAPGIVLNGWFNNKASQWPPHAAYRPIYLGFHISSYGETTLTLPEALEHYAIHGPVGCRDRCTLSILQSHGIEAFLSHCLTLTYPRRLPDPERQTETFVVSRNREILGYLPQSIGEYTFVSHYSGSRDFERNEHHATQLLKTYRERAKLVITTMLHCALPAIAMGIPVVVFYPPSDAEREFDIARLSSLSEIVRVFRATEAALVDWNGYVPHVSTLKLKLIDQFFEMASRWGPLTQLPIGPIAPSSVLPVPPRLNREQYMKDPARLAELARTKSPDRQRWGDVSSYRGDSTERAKMAAEYIRDGSRVLEIGTGTGALRTLIAHRCDYTGADLAPLDEKTLALDLDSDPMPRGSWDTVVLLEVLEYLHHPEEALRKIATVALQVLISYCCRTGDSARSVDERRDPSWTSPLTEEDLKNLATRIGFRLSGRQLSRSTPHFNEIIFWLTK